MKKEFLLSFWGKRIVIGLKVLAVKKKHSLPLKSTWMNGNIFWADALVSRIRLFVLIQTFLKPYCFDIITDIVKLIKHNFE